MWINIIPAYYVIETKGLQMKNWFLKKRLLNLLKGLLMVLLGGALLFSPEFTMVSVARLVAAFLIVKGTLAGLVYLSGCLGFAWRFFYGILFQ